MKFMSQFGGSFFSFGELIKIARFGSGLDE